MGHQLRWGHDRPMVSENYTQCKVPAHGAVTTFPKAQDSRNYSQNSPVHPIKKPSKRRLTVGEQYRGSRHRNPEYHENGRQTTHDEKCRHQARLTEQGERFNYLT